MLKIDHGYANARIRAMKGQLLDSSVFEKMLAMKDLSEILMALDKTSYRSEVHEEVLKAGGLIGIEEGLRAGTSAELQKILKIINPDARKLIEILLGRWDVQNLKTILRGRHMGAAKTEIISSLTPAGSIHDSALQELADQTDMRATIDLMATWSISYSKPLTAEFANYQQKLELQILELALDKFYYNNALAKLTARSLDTQLVREVITREIDLTNIMTLLRLTREELAPEKKETYLLAGGRWLRQDILVALAQEQDTDDLINALGKSPYGKVLQEGWQLFLTSGNFSVIERRLENHVIKKNIALFRADPLSIALIIAYIWAKLNEVVNLRILIRGKEVDMPAKMIRQALVLA